MSKRVISLLMSIAMLIGCMGNVIIASAAAREVKLFESGSTLAKGITWNGTTQYSGRGQLVHKNNGDSAVLSFRADVTGLKAITINAASAYAEEFTVAIDGEEVGTYSHGDRKTSSGKLDFADYDNEIELTHSKEGEHTLTITDLTQETYINKVTLYYEGELPDEPVEPDTSSIIIKSLANGNVIDVTNAGTANGDRIIASALTESESQKWSMNGGSDKGWYYIVNKNSGKGIGMSGGTTAAGEQPVQWDCDGSVNQFWRFVEIKKGEESYYKILNKNSKRVLTINDTNVTQEDWTGADNQLWMFEPITNMPADFSSKYDDEYAVTNISAEASSGVISYKVIYTMQEGMTLKVTLSDGQELNTAEGEFAAVADGEYTISACVYYGDEQVTNTLEKTITLKDGTYSVMGAKWILSTENNMYADYGVIETEDISAERVQEIKNTEGKVWIEVDQDTRYQTMDKYPWGGCFAEMGWSVMRDLSEDGKRAVVESLFGTGEDSLNFTAARMSISSSDFGDDMYTYADKPLAKTVNGVKYFEDADAVAEGVDGIAKPDAMSDEEAMANFSIERDVVGINGDGQSIIRYIQTALDIQPDIKIFGSPWSPPAWMKQNNTTLNGIGDSINRWEDKESNYEHYSDYFVKYIDGYASVLEDKERYQKAYPDADLTWLDRPIYIHAITPQNEVTMDTPYPSCIWTGEQLNRFIRDYLYNKVDAYNKAHTDRPDTEIWLGTFTDSQKSFAMPTIQDPVTREMLGAACFQWWGAPLATQVHMKYRDLKLVQSETKCGNSLNNWGYAEEQFDCFKEFLDAGISQYYLWNMILDSRGHNNAMPRNRQWPQNAPITVDGKTVTYRPSYYLTKHFSSNVKPEARRIKTDGNTLKNGSVKGHVQDLRAITFQNTDGEIVLNVKNSTSINTAVTVMVENKAFDVTVPANSINTFKLSGEGFEYKDESESPDATEEVAVEESTDIKLENLDTKYLLSSEGYDNGTDINTTSNKGEAYQTWSVLKTANEGNYRLKNFRSDLVLCVWSGSKDEDAKISQYNDTGAIDQTWRMELVRKDGEGAAAKYYYRIVNANSELALTALGEEDGYKVTQRKYSGADNQLWAMSVINGDWTHGEVIDDTKITEKNYSFLTDTVNSDGYIYNKKEWDVDSVPQYFYIDTVEIDKIESVTIRSGYHNGSAELAVYAYDNGGKALTQEQLKGFVRDNSKLVKLGSAITSKTTDWEYNTAVIATDGVRLSENGNEVYTLSDSSQALNAGAVKGKKALIVGISGNIGKKAYFDSAKIKYSEPVSILPDVTEPPIATDAPTVTEKPVVTEKPIIPDTEVKLELSCEWSNGGIDYSASVKNADEYDLYIAVYKADGSLERVIINAPQGSISGADEGCVIKAMAWEKNGMKPLCEAAERTLYAPVVQITVAQDCISGTEPWGKDVPNFANDAKKAADGRMNSFFDGGKGGYVLIDLLDAYYISEIGYAPRGGGFNMRMKGGEFYGSADGEQWTLLYRLEAAPEKDKMSYVQVSDESAYRYIKYSVPDEDGYLCNIAEIKLYGRTSVSNEELVARAAEDITPPSEVYGNLYLPEKSGTVAVAWSSSNTECISTDGTVTRGDEDESVTLTATLTKGSVKRTESFDVTVKAKAVGKSEEDMSAYLFVHFVAPKDASDQDEQIYFSVSQDGTSWKTLNGGKAVLVSEVGEGGMRDPHIIRSPEGDKFFLIATNLSIYNRYNVYGNTNGWDDCQRAGSKSIVVYESNDLVNWTDARLVSVARDDAGCAWAPESIYDDKSGRYMVFWASKTESAGDNLQRIYRSYTRDFKHFTEPEMYIDSRKSENDVPVNSIDTTFIKDKGVYYRFTKNEANKSVIMEYGAELDGEFTELDTYTLDGTAGNLVQGFEGPTAYKLNGEDKWCLLLDQYRGARYTPYVTDDISRGEFSKGTAFSFDATYCHGTVMPITGAEYDALTAAYPFAN